MTIDYSTLNELIQNAKNDYKYLLTTLICLIIINLIFEFFKFINSIKLLNKEKSNNKQLLLDDKRIDIQVKLFKSLSRLKLFEKDQDTDLLNAIKNINSFITNNKLFISKELQSISNEILDYFKSVIFDFNTKDIKTEAQLFDKYYNEFNKK